MVNSGWLDFSHFKEFVVFFADEHIFEKMSVKCFFTTLAEARSLNSMITWRVGVVVLVDTMYCWFDTLESMNNIA